MESAWLNVAMNHSACIAMLICSLAALCIAGFLPFLNLDLPRNQRSKFPLWTVGLAFLALVYALITLPRLRLTLPQITDALALTTAMLAGLCLKWGAETIAERKVALHEGVLLGALLAAPIMVALFPRIFGVRPTPSALALWFLHGFFWHTVFSDLERMFVKEPVIIRRREPPTLPYDFRKPEMK